MNTWSLLEKKEKVARVAFISFVLAILVCAITFFKFWFLGVMKIVYTPVGIITLFFVACAILSYLSIKNIREKNMC